VVADAVLRGEAMKVLTAHQPTYMPWCGLFDKIAQADEMVLFDIVSAEDSGFENRNKILTNAGPLMLTVPIRHSREVPLSEVRIVGDSTWRRKHWRSIEAAYHKAPFWDRYGPELKPFYMATHWQRLVDLDELLLRWCMNALGLKRPIRRASTLGPLAGSKSELVLSMCKAIGGVTEYIFGSQGRNYADVEAFRAAGIGVRFQDYQHPTYPQTQPGFVPRMSVIDLLMNVGPGSLGVLTTGTVNVYRHGSGGIGAGII